jgi:hypothetical protein
VTRVRTLVTRRGFSGDGLGDRCNRHILELGLRCRIAIGEREIVGERGVLRQNVVILLVAARAERQRQYGDERGASDRVGNLHLRCLEMRKRRAEKNLHAALSR